MANLEELMKELNPAQLRAVQHPPQVPLQILAGPGSGKTKVLTMRIAYLITYCYLPPSTLCAVTFTNKAANEMRERLVKLIGKDKTAQIKMGTFHALCAMFLRRYARVVGIGGNFTVCDADESKKIIAKLLKTYRDALSDRNLALKEHDVLSTISKVKAKGWTADDARRHVEWVNALPPQARLARYLAKENDMWEDALGLILADIYKQYEKTLRDTNSLDFDDLLMFGVKLFRIHAKASSWCRHVLVDEYQDTNIMQYELMVHIARASQCVTVVGDPDQSIYGWRSAEVANLAKMQRDFPTTQQLYLEQNYRSTGSILAISLAIVSQDQTRIQKTLHGTHPQGPRPVLREFSIEQVECAFIAAEIKRLVAYSGGMLNWGDFVVLLRYNSLSRGIESALQKEGIPNRVLAGQKFFERMEIKDVLAYLQLVDNPQFAPAFMRVVNVPSRTVGEKTVNEINLRAEQLKISPMEVVERIMDGTIPDVKPPVKKKLSGFVDTIRILRRHANEGIAPSKLINALTDSIKYKEHLAKTQPDADNRWDNVQELINFASEVERTAPTDVATKMLAAGEALHRKKIKNNDDKGHEESEEEWDDDLDEFDVDQAEEGQEQRVSADTPLRLFLQASILSTDTETPEEEKSKEKVTLATCHAAKGLEWPVVMIPAVESGVFPSTRAEDVEEERRLLYVACTRAQGLLYLSHAASRMMSGEYKPKSISPFIGCLRSEEKTKDLMTDVLPKLPVEDRKTIATVIGRSLPQDDEVVELVNAYEKTARHPCWGENAPFRTLEGAPMGDGSEWQAQQFPSVPYAGGQQNQTTRDSGNRQTIMKPPPGPAVFSSSSSLLTPSQRAGAARNTAPLSSSNSRALNAPSTPNTQHAKAGPSNRSKAVSKATVSPSVDVCKLRPFSQLPGAGKQPTPESTYVAALRRSSAGSSKEEAIDIDSLPSMPAAVKPIRVAPVTASSSRSPASSKATAPSRPVPPAPTQTTLKLEPAPTPPRSYLTPPALASPASSLPSSASCSSSAASSPALTPVAAKPPVQLAGGKRRLGMGRTIGGYTNKKFKPLTPGSS